MGQPITALQVAIARGAASKDGCISSEEFSKTGIPLFGGCRCGAQLAAYNAFPGRNGLWHCDECIGEDDAHRGFDTVEEFEAWAHGDAAAHYHGSIVLLDLRSQEARDWAEQNLPADRQTWCDSVVVDPRYIDDILEGMVRDGLRVKGGRS